MSTPRFHCELVLGFLALHLLRSGHRRAGAALHGYVSASASLTPPGVVWPSPRDDIELSAWSRAGAAMNLDEAVEHALAALSELTS